MSGKKCIPQGAAYRLKWRGRDDVISGEYMVIPEGGGGGTKKLGNEASGDEMSG